MSTAQEVSPPAEDRLATLLIEITATQATPRDTAEGSGSAAPAVSADSIGLSQTERAFFYTKADQQDFLAWMAILRPAGPFVEAHCVFQAEERAPQVLLFRNCPALNAAIFEQLAAVYQKRWVFLESEAESIFGEYYQPFLAARYLNRLTLPARAAIQISGTALKPTCDTAIVYPSPRLMYTLMWASTRLTFIVGFGLATISPAPSTVGVSAKPKLYPPLWLQVQQLLLNPNSALHAALNAPPPPASELSALAAMFELPVKSELYERYWRMWGPPITRVNWKVIRTFLRAARASGALATPYAWQRDRVALVCSPKLLSALFEHVVHSSAAPPASKRQVYSAQQISLALSEAERREVLASVFAAMRRCEVELTNSGTFSAAPLKKIAAAHWPTISIAPTRDLIDRISYAIFRGFDRPAWSDDPGWCAPSGFLEGSRWVVQSLRSVLELPILVQIATTLSDGVWSDLDDLHKPLQPVLNRAIRSRGRDLDGDLLFACFLGWWCGFFDLAFDLDAKGMKSKVRALRMNRGAMQQAFCPEVPPAHLTGNAPPCAPIVRPTYTSTVDVLPTGEILTPPDLHPLIRLCIATIFTYKGANTYAVPRFRGAQHLPLKLTSADVEELLHVISRHSVPTSVQEQIRQLPSEPPPIGFYIPDFVMTHIDKRYAEKVLTMTGETPFFAVELSQAVWGFYRVTAHRATTGLRNCEPNTILSSPLALKELLENLQRRDLWWNTKLEPLKKAGKLPVDPLAGMLQSFVEDRLAPPKYTAFKDFFDVRPTDPDWIADTVGIHIFALVPSTIRENKAFQVVLRPCVEMMASPFRRDGMRDHDF